MKTYIILLGFLLLFSIFVVAEVNNAGDMDLLSSGGNAANNVADIDLLITTPTTYNCSFSTNTTLANYNYNCTTLNITNGARVIFSNSTINYNVSVYLSSGSSLYCPNGQNCLRKY